MHFFLYTQLRSFNSLNNVLTISFTHANIIVKERFRVVGVENLPIAMGNKVVILNDGQNDTDITRTKMP